MLDNRASQFDFCLLMQKALIIILIIQIKKNDWDNLCWA